MSVEEITLAESLRTQSAKQFDRLREINKTVNLQNIELRNFQKKKMCQSYSEFIQEKHNYEKTLEILEILIRVKERLRKIKKEITLSRKSLNKIKNRQVKNRQVKMN